MRISRPKRRRRNAGNGTGIRFPAFVCALVMLLTLGLGASPASEVESGGVVVSSDNSPARNAMAFILQEAQEEAGVTKIPDEEPDDAGVAEIPDEEPEDAEEEPEEESETSLTISKAWQDSSGRPLAEAEIPAGAEAEITLYAEIGEHTERVRSIRLDGTPDEAGEDAAWTAVFDHLPRKDAEGIAITYKARETSAWEGYSPFFGSGNAYLAEGMYLHTDGTITNRQDRQGTTVVTLRNVDSEDENMLLAGAQFQILAVGENDETTPWNDGNHKDGIYAVGRAGDGQGLLSVALGDGTYRITETAVPPQYWNQELSFTLTVAEGKVSVAEDPLQLARCDDEKKTITIRNVRGMVPVKLSLFDAETKDGLSGAVFAFYENKDGKYTEIADGVSMMSDENGVFYQAELEIGTYYLGEKEAPTGFAPLGEIYELIVQKDGLRMSDEEHTVITLAQEMDENGYYALSFENGIKTIEYTIHYYLKGTRTKLADDTTGSAPYGSTVAVPEEEPTFKEIYSRYKMTRDSVTPEEGLILGDEENVLIIYYTRELQTTTLRTGGGTPVSIGGRGGSRGSRVNAKPVTLKITYTVGGGQPAPEGKTISLMSGDEYYVVSPAIEGYMPDTEIVQGTITKNTTIKVRYKKIKATLEIRYVTIDGTEIAKRYSKTMNYGANYSVPTPKVAGYRATQDAVAGTMGGTDIICTVIYLAEAEETDGDDGEAWTMNREDYEAPLGLGQSWMQQGICLE